MIGYMMNLIMAVVILLIACINFINLTTAGSSLRIKGDCHQEKCRGQQETAGDSVYERILSSVAFGLLPGFFYCGAPGTPNIFRSFGVYQEKIPGDLGILDADSWDLPCYRDCWPDSILP